MPSKSVSPQQLGSGSNRYWVEEQQITETWFSTDGKCWTGDRSLGAHSKSAADKKAWHRDGSPAKWSRTADGRQTGRLSTRTDNGRLERLKGVDYFFLAGQHLTYEEVQRLPADPSGLTAWLAKAGRVSRVPESGVDDYVKASLRLLLYGLPAPKEVRTAAYRALPTMPGVRSEGKVKGMASFNKSDIMTLLQVGWTNAAPSAPALP